MKNKAAVSDQLPTLPQIQKAIAGYAKAYEVLENLQRSSEHIPEGDQKTGAMGEFYANLYLHGKFSEAEISFGGNSNPVWDIKVKNGGEPFLIQVKTVSSFAKTGRLSPTHGGWHELFIIRLNKKLQPDGFWRVAPDVKLPKYLNAPRLEVQLSPARKRIFGQDEINEFNKYISLGQDHINLANS